MRLPACRIYTSRPQTRERPFWLRSGTAHASRALSRLRIALRIAPVVSVQQRSDSCLARYGAHTLTRRS